MPIPRATVRLQLRPGFGFDEAAAIAPYLAALGASHVYCSPYLQAAPGSEHGYDVVDPHRVNEELGGEAGRERFVTALAEAGLGQVLDVVPNHMAIALPENRWFWDVLEHGPSSSYASHFDLDWDPPESRLRNTVLMPVLGDHFGRVLEAGEIRLERQGGAFQVRYFDHVLPANPRSLADLLERAARASGSDDLAFVAHSLRRLPRAWRTDPAGREERHRDVGVLRRQLERLLSEQPAIAEAVDREVTRLEADPDAFDAVLAEQNWRLAYWRAATHDLDYRRFFDIDQLIGLRIEDEEVFRDTHARVLEWLADGSLDGVRIDHPDGLRRPAEYLERLRAAAPDAWIVVEKILEGHETLPTDWPVAGTTGYEFLNRLGQLYVDPRGQKALDALVAEVTGEPRDPEALVRVAKDQVLREVLPADHNRLTNLLLQVCEAERRFRDFTRYELHELLREVLIELPVYRTYVTEAGAARPDEAAIIARAVERARTARPDLDPELFGFLEALLSGDPEQAAQRPAAELASELRMRFQQLSGPVMAKGVEDTAFYRDVRLVGLNEVGGSLEAFGAETPEPFHRACRETHEHWPETMLALSTHDTKRSEDLRARLALLSEIPEEWTAAVRRWRGVFERHWPSGVPRDPAFELLLAQTLVGAHPLGVERALAYLEKATREAKLRTSWTAPQADYDAAVAELVTGLYADEAFAADLESFVAPLVGPGRANALSQKLIQLTSPGIPDLYQGSELWDLSLVDPDNRRPVDWDRRGALLAALEAAPSPEEILARSDEGLPKLWVVQQALALRREQPRAFGPGAAGGYRPLEASGTAAPHAVAFARGDDVRVVAPRLVLGLARLGGWGETRLDVGPGRWRNRLTGETFEGGTLRIGECLDRFPVALLSREQA